MTPLLLLFALAVSSANTRVEALDRCVTRRDRACVSALLAQASDEKSPEYWAAAARAELLLGKRQDAVQAVNRALELKPGDFDLLMEQGWVYQKSGDQVSAIRSFLSASQIEPRTPAVYYEIGMSFFLLHEFDRAIIHFKRVLELDPQHDRAEFMLGLVDVLRNGDAEAQAHFQRAMALQPDNPHYLLHYGVLLVQLNETDKALKLMLKAEELDESNPLTHFNLGTLYRQIGKLPEAERELRTAVQLRPGLARAHYQLATVYRLEGKTREAASALQQFEKFKENDNNDDPIDARLTQ
ncbi:MAG: tetratricopeptide repeat protein [Acidobacteriota bacterium]|nr:tetratricopeptide repeat protein [Acidobacteriota bacterium]